MSRDYYLKLASIYEQMQIAVKSKPVKYALLKEYTASPGYNNMLPPEEENNNMKGNNWKTLQIAGKMAKLEDEIKRLKELNAPFTDEDNQWKNLARELINMAGSASRDVLQGERDRYPKYKEQPPDMTGLENYRPNPTDDDIPVGPL